MCTFIIYCRNNHYLSETINNLIDTVPPQSLKQIILCDENNSLSKEDYPLRDSDIILNTDKRGRSQAYNQAADLAQSDILIFLQQPTKFENNWLLPLLSLSNDKNLVSPVTQVLKPDLWSLENHGWRRYGLRWDFTFYDYKLSHSNISPIAAFCLVIKTKFFQQLGGFDNNAVSGPGDNICLSLKTWLAGGTVVVADDSRIGVIPEIEAGHYDNITSLIENWFPNRTSMYYAATRQTRSSGQDVVRFLDGYERTTEDWLCDIQPDLLQLFSLYNSAHDKKIAVVGTGPSLDYVDWSGHDLVIAVDYIGNNIYCDYLVTDRPEILDDLPISSDMVVVPQTMFDVNGVVVNFPNIIALETEQSLDVQSVFPPFCDFGGNMILLAVHFALFLNPSSITLFGCDNKILGGRSHINWRGYGHGRIWADTESTRKRFLLYEFGLDRLGQLAFRLNIPLIRVGHA